MNSYQLVNKEISILKRMVLRVIYLEKELKKYEKIKTPIVIEKVKSADDILKKKDLELEYGISQKTIDRMRIRGLKSSQSSSKSTVWIVRKDFEEFLKKDRYDR